jgi:hypothetical protein
MMLVLVHLVDQFECLEDHWNNKHLLMQSNLNILIGNKNDLIVNMNNLISNMGNNVEQPVRC